MAKAISTLTIAFDFKDAGTQPIIDKIGGSIKKLQVISGPTSQTIQKLRQQVTQLGQKGTNSISTIEGQIGALKGLRREADLNSKEFKELTADIDAYTKKLQKAQGQQKRGGLGARGATQVAGAVISGGIFGGPEGALGALGGGILGGVPGAFTGAAIGAQLSGIRKLAGGMAEYVTQLNLAKATLGGVSTSIDDYNKRLGFARQISQDYSIRLIEVVKGFAGVSAAAKANGLSLEMTQKIYEGITASGVALGKSQDDLNALFLATTQVLSKGRAQAEEISGQIGERIPGAIAKFAAETNRTLPQLAKDFQLGKVTIADFVKFAEGLGEEYAEFAKGLAEGPEKAGLRLRLALDSAAEAYGGFFQSAGAGFQDYLTGLVNLVTENKGQLQRMIAQVVVFSQDVVQIFKNLAQVIGNIFGPVFKFIGQQLIDFTAAIADSFSNAELENIVRAQGGNIREIQNQARAQAIEEQGLPTLGTVKPRTAKAGASIEINPLALIQQPDQDIYQRIFRQKLQELAGVAPSKSREARVQEVLDSFKEYVPKIGSVSAPNTSLPGADSDPENDKGARSALAELSRQTNNAFRALESGFQDVARQRIQEIKSEFDLKIAEARRDENKQLAFTLAQQRELAGVNTVISGLTSQIAQRQQLIEKASGKGLDLTSAKVRQSRDQSALLAAQSAKQALINRQAVDLVTFRKQETKEIEKQSRAFEQQFTDRQKELGLISSDDYKEALLGREKQRLEDIERLTPGQRSRGLEQFRQTIDPTLQEGLTANIGKMRDELNELINPINAITNAANAIGDAFTDSFMSVITGSASTQEALSSFFKNVGKFFLDMAAQIIQKMITMFILNQVVGLLPGAGGFNSGTTKLGAGGGQVGGIGTFGPNFGIRQSAKGSYFENNIAKFAEGGIVNSPTLFSYGDGGTGRFGLMGEAGPEAIMPLQRGSDGKLGVSVAGDMRAAMGRYRGRGTTGFASSGSETGSAGDGSSAPGGAIDVRYTVERINDVDYVTAEQFQQGMQQAAQRGATEGERRTMRSLQNSTAVRRSLAF